MQQIWEQINKPASNISGSFYFEFSDEWWKGKSGDAANHKSVVGPLGMVSLEDVELKNPFWFAYHHAASPYRNDPSNPVCGNAACPADSLHDACTAAAFCSLTFP